MLCASRLLNADVDALAANQRQDEEANNGLVLNANNCLHETTLDRIGRVHVIRAETHVNAECLAEAGLLVGVQEIVEFGFGLLTHRIVRALCLHGFDEFTETGDERIRKVVRQACVRNVINIGIAAAILAGADAEDVASRHRIGDEHDTGIEQHADFIVAVLDRWCRNRAFGAQHQRDHLVTGRLFGRQGQNARHHERHRGNEAVHVVGSVEVLDPVLCEERIVTVDADRIAQRDCGHAVHVRREAAQRRGTNLQTKVDHAGPQRTGGVAAQTKDLTSTLFECKHASRWNQLVCTQLLTVGQARVAICAATHDNRHHHGIAIGGSRVARQLGWAACSALTRSQRGRNGRTQRCRGQVGEDFGNLDRRGARQQQIERGCGRIEVVGRCERGYDVVATFTRVQRLERAQCGATIGECRSRSGCSGCCADTRHRGAQRLRVVVRVEVDVDLWANVEREGNRGECQIAVQRVDDFGRNDRRGGITSDLRVRRRNCADVNCCRVTDMRCTTDRHGARRACDVVACGGRVGAVRNADARHLGDAQREQDRQVGWHVVRGQAGRTEGRQGVLLASHGHPGVERAPRGRANHATHTRLDAVDGRAGGRLDQDVGVGDVQGVDVQCTFGKYRHEALLWRNYRN